VLFDELPRLLSRDAVLPGKVFDFILLPAGRALAILIPTARGFLVWSSRSGFCP
jgi:hypothetical protein